MTNTQVIAIYENVLAVTAPLRDAARAADWDLLVKREQECRQLVDKLLNTRSEIDIVLDPQLRRRQVEIIRKVLADDAEIRNLTEPWMQRLQHLLTSVGQERKLHDAYSAGTAD